MQSSELTLVFETKAEMCYISIIHGDLLPAVMGTVRLDADTLGTLEHHLPIL